MSESAGRKSRGDILLLALALVLGLAGLAAAVTLHVHYWSGWSKKDLGFGAVFYMMLTWPLLLLGLAATLIAWFGSSAENPSRWTYAAAWIHVTAAIAWMVVLVLIEAK